MRKKLPWEEPDWNETPESRTLRLCSHLDSKCVLGDQVTSRQPRHLTAHASVCPASPKWTLKGQRSLPSSVFRQVPDLFTKCVLRRFIGLSCAPFLRMIIHSMMMIKSGASWPDSFRSTSLLFTRSSCSASQRLFPRTWVRLGRVPVGVWVTHAGRVLMTRTVPVCFQWTPILISHDFKIARYKSTMRFILTEGRVQEKPSHVRACRIRYELIFVWFMGYIPTSW